MSAFANKILLATDGSPEAESAARMAVTLANGLNSELHVVYVGRMPGAYALSEAELIDPEFQSRLRERAEQYARAKLDEEVEKIDRITGKVAEAHVGVGSPEVEIVRLAEELDAGLVVLGSRGFGPLKRALMGSVSESVVRHAHGSVLVVRGDGGEREHLPGSILLAVDSSKESRAAARDAARISAATGSELHVLFVWETAPLVSYMPYQGPEDWEVSEDFLERYRKKARAFVRREVELIEAEGGVVKEAHIALGDPEKEIVKAGEELDVGLIVLGSRGLSAVGRALLGSVSDSVVRHAHCPVLVVRSGAQQTDEQPSIVQV